MTHFAMAVVAALVVLVGCGDDDPSQDELCTVALIEGHDAYYAANCDE